MDQIKKFSIYAFTVFFNAGISFVSFSILTYYLNEVDYGIINLYNASVIFLSAFIAIGVQYAIGVDYFKMNEQTYRRHFTNALIIPVVTSIFFTLLFIFSYKPIKEFTNLTLFFILTLPLVCLLNLLYEIFLNLFRNKEKYYLFSGFSFFKNIVEIGLIFLFVVISGFNWEGRLQAFLLTLFATLTIVIYYIKKYNLFTGKFYYGEIKNIFYSGLPFIPERLAIFVLGYSDRFFINYFTGIGDVGLYGTGAQIAMIVSLAILALTNTFYPLIFKSLSETEIDYVRLRKVTLSFAGIALLVTCLVIMCTPLFFNYMIGPAFQKGQQYAFLLTIGMFFWAIYCVMLPFLLYLKKNKLIMMISLCGMSLSFALNYFNVKNFGALGATYTSITVYFVMAVLIIYFVGKYYRIGNIYSFRS